ncbi:ATP-binding protein [Nocardioides sp. BP30]|uniref:ATP-binding protein n=1 Tax=Nocardioides sp. BP30 TaxID=3036374 RepID=UPI0024697A91|nr:ATP-binding protein [Nocardioides sp. BP30]WGL53412.1 ATP-binding protein [Nocardioides sp. BP30]
MLPNPYTPGDRPRFFVGRATERQLLRDKLARVAAYGEMMGPLTIVTGPRGVGKTSLLRDVAGQAEEDGFVIAWVSCVKQHPFLAEVVDRVERSLERAGIGSSGSRRIKDLTVEVSAGFAKVRARLEAGPVAQPTALVGPLEDLLGRAGRLVRERGGSGLIVMIDELHAPLESTREWEYAPEQQALLHGGVLLNAVQNLAGERAGLPVGVIGAGLPQTKSLLTRAATFGERSHELVLGEFDDTDAARLLTEPAAALDVTWSAEAVTEVVRTARGYPQSLQILGAATWDAAAPERGSELDLAAVQAGSHAARSALASIFEARWAVATAAERAFLSAMARVQQPVVRRGEIAAMLATSTESLSMVRRNLIVKGIVEEAGYGRLRFTIPGFERFVLAQTTSTREH